MMFSMEKCSGRNCTGTTEESELFAGGGEEMGKEGVPTDEVASAVASVSDEIGDILRNEFGDADRADRIGAELADLSAELGILADLADGETQQHFPALFEIAMQASVSGSASGSGSSSSSWSWGQRYRSRRQGRSQPTNRRPIGKGKETTRRRGASNRTWHARNRRTWTPSDASDVGADDDSDAHWTDVNSGSSDSSSSKDVAEMNCNGFDGKDPEQPAPEAMGQLLLPLLCSERAPERGQVVIRREDIVQLLVSADADVFRPEELVVDQNEEAVANESYDQLISDCVSPEEEATLLHYVCEAERSVEDLSDEKFHAVEDWLLGVYHSWCEFSALMFANSMSDTVSSLKMNCRCRLCALTVFNYPAMSRLLLYSVVSLAHHAETIPLAVSIMRFLKLHSGATDLSAEQWDMARLNRLKFPQKAANIIHDQLTRISHQGELAKMLVTKVCLCHEFTQPFNANHSVERFIKILENFRQPSYVLMKLDPKNGLQPVSGERVSRKVLAWYKQNTAHANPSSVGVWANYKHQCDCLSPRNWSSQHKKQLLGMSYECLMDAISDVNNSKNAEPKNDGDKSQPTNETKSETSGELQQGEGAGAKPPDNGDIQSLGSKDEDESDLSDAAGDLDDISSTSSSMEKLEGALGARGEATRGALWRCVTRLVRSLASVERLMLCVLRHAHNVVDRKRVDLGLAEVDRKLMAMYRRLPEVHRRQLQVYKKQKKLSNVCMQLVGGSAPAAAAPPPPPRAEPPPCHLQPIAEVRRKVMHMRDQQLYYHRLRIWLEDQLRQEKDSTTDNNVTAADDIPRRKKLNANRLSSTKRKLKPVSPSLSKPYKILQMLKQQTPRFINDDIDDKTEPDPPEAFPLDKDGNISDTDTIVGEKEAGDLCKEMKECLVKFANFALSAEEKKTETEAKYPEAVSPPLQEMSPTTPEPMPVYTPKPSQRLLSIKKLMNRSSIEFKDKIDFQTQLPPDLNVPLNARRTPVLVNNETAIVKTEDLKEIDNEKDPNIHKYLTFGLEIKKAMEECQNIINSYNNTNQSTREESEEKDNDTQEVPLSLEIIFDIMMSLDESSTEFIEKVASGDQAEPTKLELTKLAEILENMPSILANMPSDLANKFTDFANATEFPELASIINSLPDDSTDAQLTPETLKQIRELKHSKLRDSVKVTKNTAKRKSNRKVKLNVENNDASSATSEECKEVALKDEKDLQALLSRDVPFLIMAPVVIKNVYEQFIHNHKNPDMDNCQKYSSLKSYIFTLFDNSVKSARNMGELRELFKTRFDTWKHFIISKFNNIPLQLLESELDAMVDRLYAHIQDLAAKYGEEDDRIMEKIDEYRRSNGDIPAETKSFKEKLKQFTKELSTTNGNTFDLLIMNIPTMSQDNKELIKRLNLKYMDVLKRCTESTQLINWILRNPTIALDALVELTNLPIEKCNLPATEDNMSYEVKKARCLGRLKAMNIVYIESLPRDSLSGNEWLVLLYRLEKLDEKICDCIVKFQPPSSPTTKTKAPALKQNNQTASEAEILAAKGLSKIIGKSSTKPAKKPTPEPPKIVENEEKTVSEVKEEKKDETTDANKEKYEMILGQFESILKLSGDPELMENFYRIKSHVTQGLPLPESYKDHFITSIGSIIHSNLMVAESLESVTKGIGVDELPPGLESIFASSESFAKFSNDLLAQFRDHFFKNSPEIPFSELEQVPTTLPLPLPPPALLEQLQQEIQQQQNQQPTQQQTQQQTQQPPHNHHPQQHQHVCKVGHNSGGCAGESSSSEQPCTCCYCTVFGHAPPLTTPVPRNFNEARERLRSILNKKKQKCKSSNEESDTPEKKPLPQPTNPPTEPQPAPKPTPKPILKPQPIMRPHPVLKPQAVSREGGGSKPLPMARAPQIVLKPAQPPALPRTQPPTLTPLQEKQKRQAIEHHQKMVERMAKMSVNEKPEIRVKNVGELQDQQKPPEVLNFTSLPDPQPPVSLIVNHQPQPQTKPEPIYDLPIHNRTSEQETQTQKPTLTPAQVEQIQNQQRQLKMQQENLEQELQIRGRQKQRNVSVSSRDTSVFSTSCDSSGESYWRENRTTDPRSVDALLQYIEGPTRHVDRGKKRAKKQRQRAKKMESKLEEERVELSCTLNCLQSNLAATKAALAHGKKALAQAKTTSKGKKKKGPQQATDQLAELTAHVNATAQEAQDLEKQVNQCARLLRECESQLSEARTLQGKPDVPSQQQQLEQAAMLHKQQLLQKQQQQQQQQLHQQRLQVLQMERQMQVAMLSANDPNSMVRVRRLPGPLAWLRSNPLSVMNSCPPPASNPEPAETKPPATERKQTWEQALAHMNQLAKSGKEKKKPKEPAPKAEPKKPKEAPKVPQPEPEPPALSKKQRKLLAKQQAIEEEEKRKKQEEEQEQQAKSKKERKAEKEAKAESKKAEKAAEKKAEQSKKTDKKQEKETKKEEKRKEAKVEKNVQSQPQKQGKQQPQPAPAVKKEKKKKNNNNNNNNNNDNVSENVTVNGNAIDFEKGLPHCLSDLDKPASCSIMEQLSCGVQVADLKLPPGITLTRVHPNEKKEPVPIKSVPVWKCSQLTSAPTPVAKPPPIIHAELPPPRHNGATEQQKTIIIPEPSQQSGKSKKNKKKSKNKTSDQTEVPQDGTKMVTLRNPMFHPNLPPVQITNNNNNNNNQQAQKKPEQIRIPDPIPMPPNACQATITPTSNGMYTIRNPLMSMMHQQTLMGVRPQNPYGPQYNYVNPNTYNPIQTSPHQPDPSRSSPKNEEFQNRIMNLASFTQKNDDGYSLFQTPDDSQQRSFLSPEFYEPKPNISPNPIGTRPMTENRYEVNDSSLFANPAQIPEPIGTPLKRDDDYGLYTPFGHVQDHTPALNRSLFSHKPDPVAVSRPVDDGDPLPYFQRLRVGAKLNSEVTIHHVTDSKFYKQDGQMEGQGGMFGHGPPSVWNNDDCSPPQHTLIDPSMYSGIDPCMNNQMPTSIEACDREMEAFKRFEYLFERRE